MTSLILIEDDPVIGEEVKMFLSENGFKVKLVRSFQEGAVEVGHFYDLAILDLNLPDGKGIELLDKLIKNNIKVIITTVVNHVDFIAGALDMGASDYLTKPFNLNILRARVSACLRDAHLEEETFDVVLKEEEGKIYYKNQKVDFTALEYQVLSYFIINRGQLCTRSRLLEKFWDSRESYVKDNTLTATIKRIRDKTSKDIIETVRGIGYRMGL